MADKNYMNSFKPDAVTSTDTPAAPPTEYMKSFVPDGPDPMVVAHAAADDAQASAKTLDVADSRPDLALGYIAGGLDPAIKALDKFKFANALRGRPAILSWAAQSPQHAALVRPDAEPLGQSEGWFSGWGDALKAGFRDIGQAEAWREFRSYALDKYHSGQPDWVTKQVQIFKAGGRDPREVERYRQQLLNPTMGPLADSATTLEEATRQYESTPHGYPQAILRAAPGMAMYMATEMATGPVGLAALMYAQNKGVLAHQIYQVSDKLGANLNPEEVDDWATNFSAAGAVTLAGLLGPVVRSMPGVKEGMQAAFGTALTRGAATSIGQAALRGLGGYGKHTFMGVLGIALQHGINTAAVQKSTTGEFDYGQLGRETGAAMWHALPVVATFAAYGPTRDFLADRGRLAAAPAERARLDAQIELAQKMQMSKTAPQRLAELFGLMGKGAKVYVDWAAAKELDLPAADVAAAEAEKSSVAVPIADYLTKHADKHEAVKDDVKLSQDGFTMNEARERSKEVRAKMPPDVADAVFGKEPDAALNFETPEEQPAAKPPSDVEKEIARLREENARLRGEPRPTTKEDVVLYRGAKGRDPSVPGVAGARFMTPDPAVAEQYASGEVFARPPAGEGKVSKEKMHFENVLSADSWEQVKEKLGLDLTKPTTMEEVLNKARDAGHDAVKFKSPKGTEYVDLMNWLHELVNQYGGTVKEWQDRLTPELIASLKEESSVGAVAPEEHAARVVEALPVRDIDPDLYERQAKKADKYIQEAAEKARSGSAAGAKASSVRDVAILSTYELARDLNRAKAKKAREVMAEVDKIRADLTKQSGDDKLRAKLNLAGSPLLHLFDVLTEGTEVTSAKNFMDTARKGWMAAHQEAVDQGAEPFSDEAAGYANARMRNALNEAAQWMKDTARPALDNETTLERLLNAPKPFDDLRPSEIRIIDDAVRQIVKAAREESTIRSKDAEATVEEGAAEIQGELRQNPSKGLPLPSGMDPTKWREWKMDANAANAILLRPKNNLRQVSKAAVKWIFNRINQAVYDRDGFFREVGNMWKLAFEAVPDEVAKRRYEMYDLSADLPMRGTEQLTNVPRQYLWKLARHRMSAGNMERVLSTSGWDSEAVDRLLFDDPKTKLTVPEWDYLQSLADVNEKYVWPKLKEHFEKYYGVAPPKTAGVPFRVELPDGTFKEYAGGYEPLKRDARPGVAPQAEPTKGIAQYWGRDFQVPWIPGSAKERVDNSHYQVDMEWDTSRATMGNTLHWLAFDQPVRDVAKLLNHQGLQADMNQYMGEGRAAMVRAWLKASATRQAQSIPEGMKVVGQMFGWQRRLQLMQIVGGSARLAAAQLSHPAGLMLGGEVNPIHGLPAFLSIFKPFSAANGEVRLFPNWNDAILHGQEVQHRADNAYSTLRRTWDQAGPDRAGPLGALKEVALKTAGLYLHAVDRLTTTWAWTAFHNQAIARGMEPFSEEAVHYADGMTQDVMPVHDVETAAPVLTNRQVGGFLIMHGFKNTLYNMRQDALAKSAGEFHRAETAGQYGSAIAKTAGRAALQVTMYGGFAIMGKFALGSGQQADETKGAWLARDFLGGQTADLPLIGGLGEPLAKFMLGGKVTRRDFSPYGNPGLAAVNKIYDTLGNLVNGGREDHKKVFDLVETALFFGGVPSRPLRVGAEHIYEKLMGESFDDIEGGGGTAGRLFYTEKQWDSIRRSLTPDEF